MKHWSPVKRIPKSVDQYWNVTEWEDVHADEYATDIYEQLMDTYEQFMSKFKKIDNSDKNYILDMLSKHPFLAYYPSTDEFVMLQTEDPVFAIKNDGTSVTLSELERISDYGRGCIKAV